MKVNSYNNINFNGILNSNLLKKGLEFASDNGAMFAAVTTLTLSLAVRPAVIMSTPNTDKNNRKAALAKSLASTFTTYIVMLLLSSPVARSMKKIDSNPQKYLREQTIDNLKNGAENLKKSKAYTLATQLFKLGLGLVAAIPRALITASLTPVILEKAAPQNESEQKNEDSVNNYSLNQPAFKGGLTDIIAKTLNKEGLQEFSKKYKDSNFPMHIVAATDALTTATFIHQIGKKKNINEKQKKPLMYNAFISTSLSILSGYIVDRLMNKPTEKFIKKFRGVNKDSVKLDKYVEGIKIAKPILITGIIYYILIPFISTFLAERADERRLLPFKD